MITEEGFCTGCRHWVIDHPNLTCPWCLDAKITGTVVDIDAGTPGEALVALKLRRQEILLELRQQGAIRREVCRRALTDLPDAAKTSGYTMKRIESWANKLEVVACARGHERVEHGKLGKDGAWQCQKCLRERPKRLRAGPDPAKRKEAASVRSAWSSYKDRMERRAQLIAEDPTAIPDRLRPEIPPPI